jgi:hypothetical protein
MKITLSTDVLNSIDTHDPKFKRFIPGWYNEYYHLEAGKEHYRLLLYLASIYNYEIISDIGTNMGASALALSTNPTNRVYSIDIESLRPDGVGGLPNCEYIFGNILCDHTIMEKVLGSKFIMLDIDHEYHNEIQIYKHLVNNGWKGLICCDDIYLNDPMKRFWNEISHPKIDVTKYGHGSGTGFIIMDDTEIELL